MLVSLPLGSNSPVQHSSRQDADTTLSFACGRLKFPMQYVANWALNTAALRGATYTDARVVAQRSRALTTKNGKVGSASDSESVGMSVRVLADGAWGFAASENPRVAVCVLPGTELVFAHEVERLSPRLWPWHDNVIKHKTAIFRQINKDRAVAHHDALEFPDGQIVLLTCLSEGQQATVLQLPAEPKTVVESEAQRRAAYIG